MDQAELALINGNLITMDKNFPRAEAAAIGRGRLLRVGNHERIQPLIGPRTRIIDLDGRTVIPGINDSHCHPGSFGVYRPPASIDVSREVVRSIREISEIIKKEAARRPAGTWIIGRGWDTGYLAETLADPARRPNRDDLDPASPDNPVALVEFSGHNMWVNSAALAAAGITAQGPEVDGGEIVRDPDTGQPSGMLLEWGARGLVDKVVPFFSQAEKKQAILTSLAEFNSMGVTSITDAAMGPGGESVARGMWSSQTLEIYQELHRTGRLTARMNILWLLGQNGAVRLEDVKSGLANWRPPQDLDPDWIRLAGIKIFADGVPIAKTSWMHRDYIDGGRGDLVIPGQTDQDKVAELESIISLAHSQGLQVGTHATGDAAIDVVAAAYVNCLIERPNDALRHNIIHGDFISPKTAKLMAAHRIGVTMQPSIATQISEQEEGIVGPTRAAYEWPMRTVLDAGVHLGLSSDAPVTWPDWRRGIASAVLRRADGSGRIMGPEQRITIAEALRAYTLGGAWLENADYVKGSLEQGKLADMCILDLDILSVAPERIAEAKILATIVDGRPVYEDEDGWGDEI